MEFIFCISRHKKTQGHERIFFMNILVESLALKGKTNIMTYFIDIPEFIIRCVYIRTIINYIPVFDSKLRFEAIKILH